MLSSLLETMQSLADGRISIYYLLAQIEAFRFSKFLLWSVHLCIHIIIIVIPEFL